MNQIRVGVVGLGYWGPNIVRNFNSAENVSVVAICDKRPEAVRKVLKHYPSIRTENDYRSITDATDIDVVCVVTPVSTHFEISRRALEQGKHIFVEKPFTASSKQAEKLIELAARKKLWVMVDHTMLFTGAVRKMKEQVEARTLGKLLYYDSLRVNLGIFQHDVNVIWDLAPHDFSVVDHLLGTYPKAVAAHGIDHFGRNLANIAYVVLYFEENIIAHCNFNWMSPVKVRQTILAGKDKILLWDDLEPDEKIKIYDSGVSVSGRENVYNLLVEYRSGDMHAPKIDRREALSAEVDYFVEGLTENRPFINDAAAGLRMVKLLEACDRSLKNKGKLVYV